MEWAGVCVGMVLVGVLVLFVCSWVVFWAGLVVLCSRWLVWYRLWVWVWVFVVLAWYCWLVGFCGLVTFGVLGLGLLFWVGFDLGFAVCFGCWVDWWVFIWCC